MSRNLITYIASLVVFVSLLCSGCGSGERDLSTPSSRLVGHWRSEGNSPIVGKTVTHTYFGPIKWGGKGKLFSVMSEKTTIESEYSIETEDKGGENITIRIYPKKDEPHTYEQAVAKDGLTRQRVGAEYEKFLAATGMQRDDIQYVDDKTTP